MRIKIGTRASKLALIQANIVASKLACNYEIIPIKTSGDKNLSAPLYDIGGKALFIKELEEALMKKEIDIAVHSLKDVPGIINPEFAIAAILKRDDPRDALVSTKASSIDSLPHNAIIGTSSPRRIAYLKYLRPDLEIVNLRGNVDTRVDKVLNHSLDGAILAYSGLQRLGIAPSDFCHPIEVKEIIPAIGQGAIAIETLADNASAYSYLNDAMSANIIKAERSFLSNIEADCKTPAGAYARLIDDNELLIDFMLATEDLQNLYTIQAKCLLNEAEMMGKKIAYEMRLKICD